MGCPLSARRAIAWLAAGSAALALQCTQGGTRSSNVPTVPVKPASGEKAEVDPIPIDIAALERIVSSSPADSKDKRLASERLEALLTLTHATKAPAPSPKAEGEQRLATLIDLARANERAGIPLALNRFWRHVACPELHAYPVPVDENGADVLVPLPQDHDERFWSEWYRAHPRPLDRARRHGTPGQSAITKAELRYRPIFGTRCAAPDSAGPESRANHLRTRAWLAIGEYYVGSPAAAGGPYALHRGREAWAHAREFAKASGDAELTVVALLGLANIQFKLQRYRAAVLAAHAALTAIDGLNSPALRDALSQRPVHVIAGSLTYVDLDGPPPDDPFIPRNDTLDLETDPLIASKRCTWVWLDCTTPRWSPRTSAGPRPSTWH